MKNTHTLSPEFVIKEIVHGSHDGSPEKSVSIEAGQYGSLWIEDAADIILLRNAIDGYLNSMPSPLISDYLRGYRPTDEPGKGVIMRTSSEIQNDLADMDDLSISEVSDAMTALGYRAHFSDSGAHGWMMRPDPQK